MFDYIAYGVCLSVMAMLMWVDATFCTGLFVSFIGCNGILAIDCAKHYIL